MKYIAPAIIIMIGIVSTRFLDMPANFSPLLALTLLSAAAFRKNKIYAWVVPLGFIFISDLVINNTIYRPFYDQEGIVWISGYMLWNYLSIILIAVWGLKILNKISLGSVTTAALGAAVLFFVISNFGSWVTMPIYPRSLSGIGMAYAAGIPFFRATLLSNLLFCYIIMGAYKLIIHVPYLFTTNDSASH